MLLSHIQVSARNIPTEIQQFQTNPIFFNENIKIGNKTIYNKSCIENGMKYTNVITKEDGHVYTYDELNTTYNVIIKVLQYSGMVRSVMDWKKTLNLENVRNKVANPVLPFPLQVYLKNKKGTQDMYKLLKESIDLPSGKISWNKKYNFDDNEWRKKIFRAIYNKTVLYSGFKQNGKIIMTYLVTADPKA